MFAKSHYVQNIKGYGFKDALQIHMTKNTMFRTEYLRIKFPCKFDFQAYPFDEHSCKLEFYDLTDPRSNRIAMETVKSLSYDGKIVNRVGKSVEINGTSILFYIYASIESPFLNKKGKPRNYAGIEFTFIRKSFGLLLGSFYIPTGTFATISIGSYIINPEIVSAIL